MFAATAFFYLILVVSSVWSQRVGKWNLGPRPEAVATDYQNGLSDREIKWNVAASLVRDYEANRKVHRRKRIAAFIGMLALIAETAALFVGLGLIESQI